MTHVRWSFLQPCGALSSTRHHLHAGLRGRSDENCSDAVYAAPHLPPFIHPSPSLKPQATTLSIALRWFGSIMVLDITGPGTSVELLGLVRKDGLLWNPPLSFQHVFTHYLLTSLCPAGRVDSGSAGRCIAFVAVAIPPVCIVCHLDYAVIEGIYYHTFVEPMLFIDPPVLQHP